MNDFVKSNLLLLSSVFVFLTAQAAQVLEPISWFEVLPRLTFSDIFILNYQPDSGLVGVGVFYDIFDKEGAYTIKRFDFLKGTTLAEARIAPSVGVTKVKANHFAVSPAGDRFAIAGYSMDVPVLDASFKELFRLREHRRESNDVTFSKDGSKIAVAANDPFVWVYNNQGNMVNVLESVEGMGWPQHVRFTSNENELVSFSTSGVIFWNISEEKPTLVKKIERFEAKRIHFNTSESLVAVSQFSEGAASIYRFPSFDLVQTFKNLEDCTEGYPCPSIGVQFIGEGKCVIVSTYGRNYVYIVETGEQVARSNVGAGSQLFGLGKSNRTIVGAGMSSYHLFETPSVCL